MFDPKEAASERYNVIPYVLRDKVCVTFSHTSDGVTWPGHYEWDDEKELEICTVCGNVFEPAYDLHYWECIWCGQWYLTVNLAADKKMRDSASCRDCYSE